ncbi:hypothetical protein CMK18_11340, partial [Candidatus Poribacteria bacterium]|nr:hypothetical protein [Candidatus Poribacteria bacterium]
FGSSIVGPKEKEAPVAATRSLSEVAEDEVRLSDHQKKPDELILDPKEFFATTPVHPQGKVTMTWGYLKK